MTAQERYAAIIDVLLTHSGVTLGSASKKGFAASALMVGQKIFAMLNSKDEFVVKLPKQRVDTLIATGEGKRFDPGHGRLMKEWLVVAPTFEDQWLLLAQEAMTFVASQQGSRIKSS